MEYDNDRLVKKTEKIEIACWIFFVLLGTLVNSAARFPNQPAAWWLLLTVSLLVAPLYILYARLIVPRFLFTRQYGLFAALTTAALIIIFFTVFLLYKIALVFDHDAWTGYFTWSTASVIREISWVIINGCLAVSIAYLKKSLDEKDTTAALQKEAAYYKIRYLRTQLNPHFLFNTLNSIYSLSFHHAAKTPEVIIRLSDIMRFLLYECNEEKIPIEKEIEFIRNYIEIERIRYDADIQLTVEGETAGIMIEPFLFISFIENGFKHAIDNSFARPFIYITLKISPQQVILNVINNTSLELETQAKRIQGRGLENSKSVLELLYPEAYALDIIQTEKGERKDSKMRLKNAQERLQRLYPDNHTLDVILSNNTFTVSLIILINSLDKVHHYRR
jgi:two-component system LytT family sensor kinase